MRPFLIALACSLLWSQPARSADKAQPNKPVPAASDTADKEKKDLPLTPTRTIEFTTEEGTWISLDLSPDGQSLMFDLHGLMVSIDAEIAV